MGRHSESSRRPARLGTWIGVIVAALVFGPPAGAGSDAEAIAALEAKADAAEAKLDSIEAKSDQSTAAVAALEAKADAAEAKLDSIEAKADQSTAAVSAIEAKADALEAKTDAIEAKADAIEAKVDAIEAKIDALTPGGDGQLDRDLEHDLLFDDRIAFWYLPQALGGHLEDVRQKVIDTQAAVAASGEAIQPGFQSRFNQAELFRSNNQYRKAFDNYAVAYCLLVSVPGEACPR